MARKDDLKAEAVALGLTVEDGDTVAALEAKIADKKAADAAAGGNAANQNANAGNDASKDAAAAKNGAKTASKGVYYLLNVPCYINDKQVLPAGLYRFDGRNERLDKISKISKAYAVCFDGGNVPKGSATPIPQPDLHKIANTLRVSLKAADGSYRDDEAILAEIVKEPVPMK